MESSVIADLLREQLLDRRARLEHTMQDVGQVADVVRLLHEVDSALKRVDGHTIGGCDVCGERVEDDVLMAHPQMPWCLCRLSAKQQDALQKDLDLAWRIQAALLPKQDLGFAGWTAHFRYQPAGPVSGDFCDVITRAGSDEMFFCVGDVSGKGVASSLYMARLSALLRTLVETDLDLPRLVERANRLFSEAAPTSHFATLVCGRAEASGELELCNAGHCPPLLIRDGEVLRFESTGLPVGMFEGGKYEVRRARLEPGETLLLYTDGVTETRNPGGDEYGEQRLTEILARCGPCSTADLAETCLSDLATFREKDERHDDLTLLVVRRE